MNFGFFGIQYSFGLQQTNMSPIYSYLGADPDNLPFLWLACPIYHRGNCLRQCHFVFGFHDQRTSADGS